MDGWMHCPWPYTRYQNTMVLSFDTINGPWYLHNTFFVRETEQKNFCSAYPEVVEGEVGQSHAGDVFRELLQDLRVLCLQVDKRNLITL